MKIEDEIVQKTFKNPLEKAIVNVIFTSNWFNSATSDLLKASDITIQQFNILRILKGQYPKPATITLLTERMIDKMSNASRLVDKLLKKGLVERTTCPEDRRQVHVLITTNGMDLLAALSAKIDLEQSKNNNLTESELNQLNDLLDKLRG